MIDRPTLHSRCHLILQWSAQASLFTQLLLPWFPCLKVSPLSRSNAFWKYSFILFLYFYVPGLQQIFQWASGVRYSVSEESLCEVDILCRFLRIGTDTFEMIVGWCNKCCPSEIWPCLCSRYSAICQEVWQNSKWIVSNQLTTNQPKQPNQNQPKTAETAQQWVLHWQYHTHFYIKVKMVLFMYHFLFAVSLVSFLIGKTLFPFAQHAPASVPAVLMASGRVWKRLSPPCIKDTSSSHVRETDLRGCILLFSLLLHCQLLLWCEREFIIGWLRRRDERREAGEREREGGRGRSGGESVDLILCKWRLLCCGRQLCLPLFISLSFVNLMPECRLQKAGASA